MIEMSETAKEARRQYKREWQKKNASHVNAYARKWRKKNPEKVAATEARYWEKRAEENESTIEMR